MRSVNNPIFIPRNHKVEEALKDANENKLETLNKLLEVIKNPYKDNENVKGLSTTYAPYL